jgi:hypothetical protein
MTFGIEFAFDLFKGLLKASWGCGSTSQIGDI